MPLDGEWARADVLRVLRDVCPNDRLDWDDIAKVYNFDLQALDDPHGVVPITAWHGAFEYVSDASARRRDHVRLVQQAGCRQLFHF